MFSASAISSLQHCKLASEREEIRSDFPAATLKAMRVVSDGSEGSSNKTNFEVGKPDGEAQSSPC